MDATGTRFVGTWDDTSAWTGEGELTRHDGATYMGTWLASERHGYGHARHTDGTSYKGTYWHNRRHGRGVIRDADDNIVWDGDLDDGVRHGRGVLTEITTIELTELAEPTVVTITWDGTWAGGRFHGLGTWERSDGVFYRGEWRNGQRAGRGDSRDEDGSVYDGEWRNDVRHGQGEVSSELAGIRPGCRRLTSSATSNAGNVCRRSKVRWAVGRRCLPWRWQA